MNMHPKDEFDGVFDHLSSRYFGPMSTTTFPSEVHDFDEFVSTRLEMVRISFLSGPTDSLTHVALSNSRVVCQLVPEAKETTAQFFERVTRHARGMHAKSLFYCRLTDASSLSDEAGFCVLWIAHHVGIEQRLRSGLILIEDGGLGETQESPENSDLGPTGEIFTHILQ